MSTLDASTVGEVVARARFDAQGLLPAVVQQHDTREVLMLGYMNAEALRRTLIEGRVTYWSRSRQEYWRKGDTSGHIQLVRGAALDCDGDTLLLQVEQIGPACHTGEHAEEGQHDHAGGGPAGPVVRGGVAVVVVVGGLLERR